MLVSPSRPPGCTSPSLLRLPSQWGICLLEPVGISVSPPKRAGLRTGCMEPPKPQGSAEEGEASSRRRAPTSTFLLSSGPASFHSSAWMGKSHGESHQHCSDTGPWLGCAAQQQGGALFFSSPLPYKHLRKNKMHFPGGSDGELTTSPLATLVPLHEHFAGLNPCLQHQPNASTPKTNLQKPQHLTHFR